MEGYTHGPGYREVEERQGSSRSVTDLFRLDKRTIIVTVAGGDWGTAIIDAIPESGGDVVGLDLDNVHLDVEAELKQETWEHIQATAEKYARKVAYYPLDVTDEKTVNVIFSSFIPTLRYPVRGLVSVAGMGYLGSATVFEASNFGSVAIHQLVRSLAAEWGSRLEMPLIRVPGVESAWSEEKMLNQLSTPDKYRAPVIFMLGDGSSFVTGADLRVDGGHCAW
ncbi:uncharacterized protein ASPGLDRAFT_63510 [Aspergillus glaucus CBS 516.65]|uniref:Uncharacterized protein n=1 Tax=Aspergillus glaucus CBS 516.65 TaxID=1160497 RepID=A0A1L9VXN0_ASPGL|nr:hypothetical protein ASPGLDRAFT_63510 [Aspergillus glaucus CBS 516.65]OJJ88674.1 hypothetical protein ASPGLDRAFT_63510 [Aspergillus glaucus CBS 516.65]